MKFFKLLIILFLVIGIVNCTHSDEINNKFLESPHWFLHGVPAPLSTTLDSMMNSTIPYQVKLLQTYMSNLNLKGNWVVDTIGYLEEQQVLDLNYEIQYPNRKDSTIKYSVIAIKAIVVETRNNKYRLIDLSSSSPPGDIGYKLSKIIQIDGQEILYTRSQMSGTGRFFDESYWIWDSSENIIKKLNKRNAIGFAFQKVLPPKHGVWKGGHFDITSMSFESFTWREGDGNCCPTGGKVTIKFEILSNQIIVKDALFDYRDLEERAMYSVDSIYTNTPPIVYHRQENLSVETSKSSLFLNTSELRYEPVPSPTTLEKIINSYVRNRVSGMIYDSDRRTTKFTWIADTIGYLSTSPIVDVSYKIHCKRCGRNSGRIICFELNKDTYKLLYLETNKLVDTPYETSKLIINNFDTLLYIPGYYTDYKFFSNNYWLITKSNQNLIPLHQEWVLNRTLDYINSSLLSDSLSVRFNTLSNGKRYRDVNAKWYANSLTYKTAVWKDSDKAIPTGGCMEIKFDIKNHRLIPFEYSLDSTDTCSWNQ